MSHTAFSRGKSFGVDLSDNTRVPALAALALFRWYSICYYFFRDLFLDSGFTPVSLRLQFSEA
jgi:hypothetical protein